MNNIINVSSKISLMNLENKRVFLRADLNVPIKNKIVVSEYRIKAIFPTIDLILKKRGKIILATHIGRPKNKDPHFSTRILCNIFKKYNYKVEFESCLEMAYKKSFSKKNTILLLENMRFFPEEKKQNNAFAYKLFKLADYYINDAFGLLHRNDTSITLVPKLFTKEHKTIGLLIENELKILNKILISPEKPFTIIVGGGKIKDKLPLIKNLLDKVSTIILCPAICFTFLKAINKKIGKSLYDESLLNESKNILKKAKEKEISIIFPKDYLVAENNFNGKLSYINADNFSENKVGLSIGPKTKDHITPFIKNAKTLFFNGAIGDIHRIETLKGMESILNEMGNSNGFSIVAGGDSVAVVEKLSFYKKINYCSTGGGATLTYLSGQPLIGLNNTINK